MFVHPQLAVGEVGQQPQQDQVVQQAAMEPQQQFLLLQLVKAIMVEETLEQLTRLVAVLAAVVVQEGLVLMEPTLLAVMVVLV
jgi:hypothetical protein